MYRIAVLCSILFFQLSGSGPSSTRMDEVILTTMLADQATAWDRGDGTGWAMHFSPDADFINIRGDLFHGRLEIAQRHAALFAGPFKGTHVKVTVRKMTFLPEGIALVDTDQEVTGFHALVPGVAPTSDGLLLTRMSYIAYKDDEGWRFIRAQNTAVAPLSK